VNENDIARFASPALSPTATPETFGPNAATSPAISMPGKSDAPGGGG
jgi:hypothetical protein